MCTTMIQNRLYFAETFLWIALHCSAQVLATSCQVYPTEYAYLDSSVTRIERASAKCRRYPTMSLAASVMADDYTHCDGTQLRLTDSDLGSEQYSSSDYYVWGDGSSDYQLLFIFPARVNLTTITLHYYINNVRGLPRLRFFAVPDDFEIWDALSGIYSYVDIASVPPGEKPAGHRKVSRNNLHLYTRKLIIIKSRSEFTFALSEVEFLTCNDINIGVTTKTNQHITSGRISPAYPLTTAGNTVASNAYKTEHTTSQPDFDISQPSGDIFIIPLAAGVILTVLILLVATVVLATLLLLWHKKRTQKNKIRSNLDNQDGLYCTLDRGTKLQPQTQYASTDVYDQIQLSPSTGQSEPISEQTKKKNVNMFVLSTQLDCHNMEKQLKTEAEKPNNNPEFATYAVVDKHKKSKSTFKKEESSKSHDNTPGKGIPLDCEGSVKAIVSVEHDKAYYSKYQQSERNENLEEMYAVVQKKSKKCEEQEGIAPPVPSHTTESLYTAVQKKPKH